MKKPELLAPGGSLEKLKTAIEGLDSQDGIDSLTENRQKFIRKTEQAMEDKNENLRKKNENFVSRCVCFILQKIFLYSISLPECFLKEPKPVMIP